MEVYISDGGAWFSSLLGENGKIRFSEVVRRVEYDEAAFFPTFPEKTL